ncbi:MAG: LacI family transcriptional regulator [Clostridiales Family XIII bacterium]|jgi:DNA-binding LacI/PurR family transcriptional regulator|nr:LacI family transcriptional regulator [Clostridiales Family XIII bacterium]
MNHSKSFGLKEIAQLSNVSIATASRVFSNPQKTSSSTRDKVLAIAKEHDYYPNAQKLISANGKEHTIALFISDIDNQFNVNILDLLNKMAFKNNLNFVTCIANGNYDLELQHYEYFKTLNTQAYIYGSDTGEKIFNLENTEPIAKTIFLDHEDVPNLQNYTVTSNNKKGISLLVDYLYKLNHRKIAYISGPTDILLSAQERKEGFITAMEKLDLEVPPHYIVEGNLGIHNGISHFDYFYSMSDAPTAIICGSDVIARGFIMRANSLGVRIPNEFSVCGFDGLNDDTFYPAITSVKQNLKKIVNTISTIISEPDDEISTKKKVLDVSISHGMTCHKI